MQTAGKFGTTDIKLKSLVQQSLNSTNIDLPINLVELKNQILAEAKGSLVDQASPQYSNILALLKL